MKESSRGWLSRDGAAMSAGVRVGGFAALLVAIFAIASVTGAAVDPDVSESDHEESMETQNGQSAHGGSNEDAGGVPGLAVAQSGYSLVPESTRIARGEPTQYRFQITGEGGETVEDFDVEHERRMHLIVVRRDFQGFQHLHPRQLKDGGWEVDLEISEAGVYRVFADFATGGTSLTLASDLFVPGPFEPARLPEPSGTADAGDGYEVSLESEVPTAGGTNPAQFVISQNGNELESLEPYLGADGHLVALREHDQAFLHTHPEGEAGGPGPISFAVEYPSAGRYRLYLQFKHRGEVRTAAFTQEVTDNGEPGEVAHGAEREASHGGH
jgi:hypothetical protein